MQIPNLQRPLAAKSWTNLTLAWLSSAVKQPEHSVVVVLVSFLFWLWMVNASDAYTNYSSVPEPVFPCVCVSHLKNKSLPTSSTFWPHSCRYLEDLIWGAHIFLLWNASPHLSSRLRGNFHPTNPVKFITTGMTRGRSNLPGCSVGKKMAGLLLPITFLFLFWDCFALGMGNQLRWLAGSGRVERSVMQTKYSLIPGD